MLNIIYFTFSAVPPDMNELLNSLKTARHNLEEPDSEDQRLNGKGVGVKSEQ